ncbi:MAG: SUMF1/EgtB/PvdO family nonheme iron enzyme [Thermoflexales bacterium]|nr:SUMF1/EgtB/PvdO family nonheme iron enzyme [Thermoflexales bacterium]
MPWVTDTWGQAENVLRGGNWNDNPANVRAANRNDNAPDNRNDNVGFRCVVVGAPREVPASQVRRVYGRGATPKGSSPGLFPVVRHSAPHQRTMCPALCGRS